jgi:tubulin polyglutamylase TTLL6/13
LGRFATEKYQGIKKKNMKDVHMHLTNYAINKSNKKFIFNTSEKEMDKGHKRSLSAIYKAMDNNGIDSKLISNKIDELIIKTLIVGQPMIAHTYSLAQADTHANDLCFHILGFDILINEQLEPILLEVNHTPSFRTDTPLDKFIKKNLIKDTLNLLNINTRNKKEKIERKKK